MPSKRKRQMTLGFDPLPSSSPASKEYNQQIRDRAAAVTIDHAPGSMSHKRRKRGVQTSLPFSTATTTSGAQDESDSEPVRGTQRRGHTQSSPAIPKMPVISPNSSSYMASSGMFRPQRRKDGGHGSESSEDLPAVEERVTRSSRKRNATARTRDETDDEMDEETNTVAHAPALPVASDGDEDDGMPTTTGTQRRRRRVPYRTSLPSSSPLYAAEDSDSSLNVVGAPDTATDSGREHDSTPKTPSQGRLKRARHMSQQDKDDLAEDLDFLAPSDSEKTPRSSKSAMKSAKQKALERLKRRRSGRLDVSEEQDEDEGHEYEDESYEVHEVDDTDEPYITSSHQIFREQEDDVDFLAEEEEDGSLGVPLDIPLAFTRFASMKPKQLFKYAVEWFVQKKINPAFGMTDEIYDMTFKKLNDEVKGLAGSKFTSSAWTQNFTLALNARPDVAVDGSSHGLSLSDKCDACNRSGHPATFTVQFLGKPYHAETLEDIDAADDDDDLSSQSEDGIQPEYDANGSVVPPESTIFNVGKFCTANAETAHSLRHWRYHLNEWVVTWLVAQGYCSPERLLERDGWKTKKRRKYANKIVDRMEEEGVVKELWKNFRNNADTARNAKQGRYDVSSP